MSNNNSSVLLTTTQVAKHLNVHRVTVWEWWNKGRLKAAQVLEGTQRPRPLFTLAEVERFDAARKDV